jgi:hypothetical protein
MCSIRVPSALGVSLLCALVGVAPSPADPPEARREASAKKVALGFAESWNARSKDRLLNVATIPFFGGTYGIGRGGSAPPLVKTNLCRTEKELGEYLDNSFHGPRLQFLPGDRVPRPLGNQYQLLVSRPAGKLSTEVQRIETYADFRKKYMEKDWPEKDFPRHQIQQTARETLDAVLRPDDLIVYVGSKAGVSEGILMHFADGPLGAAKVAGILGDLNPAVRGLFGAENPIPK